MSGNEEGAGKTGGAAGPDAKKDALFEDRPKHKKLIRVVTVIAYMISVSSAAIVLSAYYVFLWHPPNPRLMHAAHPRADPQVEYLVNRPPTEVTTSETNSAIDMRDKVDAFRNEILRNRELNVSVRTKQRNLEEDTKNLNASHEAVNIMKNGMFRNNSRNSTEIWNPIVRTLLATMETPLTGEKSFNSTGVYKSVNVAVESSLKPDSFEASTLFVEPKEINGLSSTLSLPTGEDKFNSVPLSKFSSAVDFTSVDAKSNGCNETLDHSSDDNRSAVAEEGIGDMSTTEDEVTVKILGSTEVSLDYVGRSGTSKPIVSDTIGASGVVDEATVRNFDTSGSSSPRILQDPEQRITAFYNKVNDEARKLAVSVRSRELGKIYFTLLRGYTTLTV